MLALQGIGFLCCIAVVGWTSLGALGSALPLRRWARLPPSRSQKLADVVHQVRAGALPAARKDSVRLCASALSTASGPHVC